MLNKVGHPKGQYQFFSGKTSTIIFSIAVYLLLSPISRAQWVQIGPGNLTVYSLAVSGSNVFAATDSEIYRSTNNGQNWSIIFSSQYVYSLAASDSNIFAGTGQGVYKSTNNGQNWTLTLSGQYFHLLAISGSNIFAGTAYSSSLYRSTNNGENWSLLPLTADLTALAVSDTTVFAGDVICDDGGDCWSSIYRSTDNGENWIVRGAFGPIGSLAASGTNVFAHFASNRGYPLGGIYRSTNSGENWMLTSNDYASSFAISGSNVFAGGGGVYLSRNTGLNWLQWGEGMGNLGVYALAVNSTSVFAGTYQNSVWKRLLSDTLVGLKNIGSSIPEEYYLYQNYPNPFNPVTTIRYALPKASFVTLKIYDILGSEITTLVNEQLQPGSYEVDWDASDYSSGVYFYKLTSENYSETKRMVLIK